MSIAHDMPKCNVTHQVKNPPLHRLASLRRPLRRIRFRHPFFHDGTERPIQRPKAAKPQQAYYSGKKKPHTVKNLLIINDEGKILLFERDGPPRMNTQF